MEHRLQKILARAGVASRRAAERLIEAGRVRVNGRVVTELGTRADPRKDRVEVDGKRLVAESLVYFVLHKPRGYVTTLKDPEGRPTIADLIKGIGARVFPVGRLDFSTSGALLLTNDGDFSDALLHPREDVPKTYIVKVSRPMQEKDLERWRRGIRLEDGVTKPAQVKLIRTSPLGGEQQDLREDSPADKSKTWIEITITEGRNQQIRRMGEATGFRVMRLARTSFAGITHEALRPGQWRMLTKEELLNLKKTYGVPKVI